MATITLSVTVRRPPDEVYGYIDDLSKHPEWQTAIESREILSDGPTSVGTEVKDVRVVGGGSRKVDQSWRVTEHDPTAQRSAFETLEGQMMRPSGVISVSPAGEGS